MVLAGFLEPRGLRINDVCPGAVATPLKIAATEEIYRRTGDKAGYDATMASLVAAEGIANVYAWLASDDAGDVKGTIFTR
jgi:NAD(P)-dependent dehydrogenase (short-subunit alcohol dehydrogenase family)